MTTLHVVHRTVAGYCREDPHGSDVEGVYEDPELAGKIARLIGGKVTPVVLNHIWPGRTDYAKALGVPLP